MEVPGPPVVATNPRATCFGCPAASSQPSGYRPPGTVGSAPRTVRGSPPTGVKVNAKVPDSTVAPAAVLIVRPVGFRAASTGTSEPCSDRACSGTGADRGEVAVLASAQ